MNWSPKSFRLWISIPVGIFLLWLMLHHADVGLLLHHLQDLSILWVVISFICATISYLCIAGVLQALLVALQYKLRPIEIFNVALISTVANYAINIGGISGLAVKVYLLSKRNIHSSHTLSISLVHGFFTNTIALFFILVGFAVFYGHYSFGWGVWLLILITAVMFIWLGLFIVNNSVRVSSLSLFMKIYRFISRHLKYLESESKAIESYFESFNHSMNLLVKNSKQLALASFYALADWLFMFACLKTAFLAVHCKAKIGILAIGFCISLFTSVIAIIPGGLGITEGSMVSVFYLLGLEYEKSLIGVLIYRMFYYFIPIIAGIVAFFAESHHSTPDVK